MSPFVLGDEFLDRLVELEVVPENVTHVVIDAKWGEPVKFYFSVIELDKDKLRVIAETASEVLVEDNNE